MEATSHKNPHPSIGRALLLRAADASRQAAEAVADAVSGMQTRRAPDDPAPAGEYDVRYEPSRWSALRILGRRAVAHDDVFLDLGCGKGRVLYLAAWYPFARIVGVEADPVLAEAARRNLRRARGVRRLRSVSVVASRIEDYPVSDDVTVVYLFNPFRGPVLAQLCDRLRASVGHRPRRLRVIYVNPVEEPILLRRGFRPVRRSGRVVLYEYAR